MGNESGTSVEGTRRSVAEAARSALRAACSSSAFIGLLHSLSLSLPVVVAVSSSLSLSSFLISFLLSGAGTSAGGEEDVAGLVEVFEEFAVLLEFVESEVETWAGAGVDVEGVVFATGLRFDKRDGRRRRCGCCCCC